ncbi:uncharacterized protein FIBRA_05335 [Fibroporia radiculosa]|uniref:Protein kinase domain-containing protein n=1 Tax=Fibroporia radiculosa TaxID=599839 RepID=J4IAN3_9APHY|nr:uncharacterized protein FIBRA_05335 [Fibroporia radiculosa]CCM03211.1 predicted protein [Fibroporia radiculosa]
MSTNAENRSYSPEIDPGDLEPHEYFWRDHQPWLEERGYMLRPRYRPDWVPSWKGTSKRYWSCEDGQAIQRSQIIDATRIADGDMVALKKVEISKHPYEVEIGNFLSSEPFISHPRNHCVPIYEVLRVPDDSDVVLLVMPLLRRFNSPRFQTIGEAIEFFHQVFEALQFMHQLRIAHRDCMNLNIMMDPKPLYPQMYHPVLGLRSHNFTGTAKHYTRTARPTKYYLIDFGISRRYDPAITSPREPPIRGGDKTVPEFQHSDDPCDPFPTDIYYLGNMIREDFLQTKQGFEFMRPLVDDMVQDDPSLRPTIDQVVMRFQEIRQGLGYWRLRSRIVDLEELFVDRVYRNTKYIFRTIGYLLTFRSPVPTP